MLRSDLSDYSDAYIVVKGTEDLLDDAANENYNAEKKVAFKNNAPFRSCISKINNTLLDNADNLGIVMLMYNYSMILGIFWNYYRDENDDVDVNDNVSDGTSLEYETKIVGETP